MSNGKSNPTELTNEDLDSAPASGGSSSDGKLNKILDAHLDTQLRAADANLRLQSESSVLSSYEETRIRISSQL